MGFEKRAPDGSSDWVSTQGYSEHDASNFDAMTPGWLEPFVRSESMDLVNDPRYFSGNVIDKRLGALGKITVVSSLMLGTSFGQMFSLKKDMDFGELEFGWLPIGWIQFLSFLLQMCVTFVCMTTIYVLVHQTFFTLRLMTAGPHGFEQASMFYLNRQMCMWRRLAVNSLFNGLIVYLLATGLLVFVKFFKDAAAKNGGPQVLEALNAGASALQGEAQGSPAGPKLDIHLHTAIGAVLWLCFTCFGFFLMYLRSAHLSAFRKHYSYSHGMTIPLVDTRQGMATRAGLLIET